MAVSKGHNSDEDTLPEKLYYKIGEVSEIAGVPPYVLRFWEGEFKRIRPTRTPTGQRLYRKKDVELILRIKHLLYDEHFTIRGANRFLGTLREEEPPSPSHPALKEIKAGLEEILALLDRDWRSIRTEF